MTTSGERVLAELGALGVRLWAEDGQVRFRAPKGVLTGERLDELKRHKADVLDLLTRGRLDLRPDPEHRHDPFPLTEVQQAYLLGRRPVFDYGGVACHGYLELAVPEVDTERLDAAWRALVDRHDMLRAVVHPDGHQRVLPRAPHRLLVSDGSDADFAERVAAARADMAHRVYPTEQAPLHELRVTRGQTQVMLHLSIDLLVADYLSVQLMLSELDTLYREPDAELPSPSIGFRDHVLAERRARDTDPVAARDRAYWWDRLDELPAAPELPLRDGAGTGSPVRFHREGLRLDPARWRALRDNAARHGVTASTAVLAAYAEVVGRWSRHPRFTLNLTMLNRPQGHPDLAALVGDFTAVTLLAVDRTAGTTAAERARAIQDQLWSDLDHRGCGGVEVLRELGRRRGSALMPVVYTSTIGMGEVEFPAGGLLADAEVVGGLSQTPQVWLDCQAMEWRGALLVNWDVRDDVFPPGLVADAFVAFAELLGRLADDPDSWTAPSSLDLPAAQELRRAMVNDTSAPLPESLLHEGVLAAADAHPDRLAVIAAGGTASYGELVGRARAVATELPAGELVGVLLDKGVDQVAAVLGVLMAGSAYLPVDTAQPVARRDAILADAGVTHVVTDARDLPEAITAIRVDDLADAAGWTPPESAVKPDEPAYVIYTSGSTGTPKGVVVSHRAAVNTVIDINARFAVSAADRVLGLAGLGFDLSVYDIFGVLAAGGALVLPDPARRADPSHWADLVAEHGVTLWNSVPAQLQMLAHYLDSDPSVALPTLRVALLSGDWIPVTLPDEIRFRLPGLELTSLGGATEAAIWSIAHPIGEVAPDARSIPYGTPLANQTFHVLDERGLPCPDWVPGELHIGGAGLALGYLGDAERTAERFVTWHGERLYRTGDLGRYLPDGTIEFLGRDDDQVKIRGHRIELAEVEAALTAQPGVAAAAAVVDGDTPLERRLVAFAQPARLDPTPSTAGQTARVAAAEHAAGIDRAGVAELVRRADQVALLAMVRTLRAAGLSESTTVDEIIAAVGAPEKYHRLVRRWLAALVAGGELRGDGTSYSEPREVPDEEFAAGWRGLEELAAKLDYGAELVRYLRTSTENLPGLLRGDVDPLALLFPGGSLETAEAAYRDNLLSRHLNHMVTAVVTDLAAGADLPLRVLEVGAGAGGTSTDLIAALHAHPVDYLFTDISQFFLNEAATRHADRPWVRFGLFDINTEIRDQGLEPNSVDVLVCANVLHNSRDAGTVLARLRDLLAPGGHLVFIEATRENHPLLVSMEFKEGLDGFTDLRAGTDQTFLDRGQWLDLLATAGLDPQAVLPEADDPLSHAGQHVFVARAKADRAPLHPAEIAAHAATLLPAHMVPAHVQVVDALPLTANAKVDRAALRAWLPRAAGERAGTGRPPEGELESRVAAVWEEVLGRTGIGRDDDFFAAGGDSLLAAQLIGRLREHEPAAAAHDWDTLLRHLLRKPTVAALAAVLAESPEPVTAAGEGPRSPIVRLAEGDPHAARVLVHDGGGTLAPYRSLIDLMPTGPTLLGLEVADAAAYAAMDASTTVVELGARYARDLLATGCGRFELVGYCMGGLIATEVARALTEAGAEVESLTVVSGYRFPYRVADEVMVEYAFARVLGADPTALGYPPDDADFAAAIDASLAATPGVLDLGSRTGPVGDRIRLLAGRSPDERRSVIAAAVADGSGAAQRIADIYPVFAQSLRAVTSYDPLPYAGDITFLRDSGHIDLFPALRTDMAEYWRGVCLGELRVVDIPGDHFTCLDRPHVTAVRDELAGAR